MTTLTHFSHNDATAVTKDTSEVRVSGDPAHTSWLHFSGAGDTVRSGVWQSTDGQFKGPMNSQIEFCHILEGEATLTLEDGTEHRVEAGDSFVMDNGLQPVWTVPRFVKKSFVIVQLPSKD